MKLLFSTILLFFTVYLGSAQTCFLSFTHTDSLPNGSIWVTATLTGPSPTYVWSNGATSPTIEITSPGVYLVTATNAQGCTVGSGYVAECETRIRQEGIILKAYKLLGGTGLSYVWSSGETTQSISPSQSGNYCVTVTGSNDCSGGNGQHINTNCADFNASIYCSTSITYNNNNTLTANGSGQAPFTYHWSPGNYTTQTIDPGVAGYYCVTVTNAAGCSSVNCRYLYSPGQCDPEIVFIPDSSAVGGQLYAQTEGQWTGDWTFLWSTGGTTSIISPTVGGEYCVTVTNGQTGCISSGCYWIWPDSLCYAEILQDSIGLNDAFLSVSSGPYPIVSYQWSNGSTAAINQVTSPGWQSVTVTNSEGCTVSANTYLYENQSLVVSVEFPDSIGFGINGVHALIYLIEYDTAQGGILTALETVETHSWTNSSAIGQFYDVPPGDYLIKAALLPNSNGYSDHLPTYYESAIFWNAATPEAYRTFGSPWEIKRISMIPGLNPGGFGFIGGLVSEGANVHGGSGAEFTGEGDPIAGISVVLTLADGTPVAATVTDANGQYSFDYIAWGTYTITVDIPGLPLVSTTVTISPAYPATANINFKVDENSIALPIRENYLKKVIEVFPNPTQDELFIDTPENAELTLTDAFGKTVLQAKGANAKTKLSLDYLSSGIYFLTVRTTGTIEIVKVIKQ